MAHIRGKLSPGGKLANIEVMKRADEKGVFIRINRHLSFRLNEHYTMKLANVLADSIETWEPR